MRLNYCTVTWYCGHYLPTVPARAIGGMKIGRRYRSTRSKPVLVPLCPPQIPHDLTRARNRAAAVGSQRLTGWAMAWPSRFLSYRVNTQTLAHSPSFVTSRTLYSQPYETKSFIRTVEPHYNGLVGARGCPF
jgi:hypothetical protein